MPPQNTLTNQDLAVSIARVEERLEGVSEDLHRVQGTLDQFLNGSNGRPGVIERLALNEVAIVGLGSRLDSLDNRVDSVSKSRPRTEGLGTKATLKLIGIIGTLATALSAVVNHLVSG